MNMHVPALQRSLSDVVAEYDKKKAELSAAFVAYAEAGDTLKMACTVGGTFGRENIETRSPYESTGERSLLKSAWYHIYEGLNIARIASPNDKRLFEQAMSSPPEFTIDNIRATFGNYILDPRGNILRALAEVFCGLDDFYKSHDRVKIGVEGLPKRIVLSHVAGYGSYGRDKLISVMNALASYQGKPLIEHGELAPIDALHKWDGHIAGVVDLTYQFVSDGCDPIPKSRGVTIKKYKNGNAHVMFDKDTLRDINMALAEYYGDVLPDTPDEKPMKKQTGTAVSKDLQYFPTPLKVVKQIVDGYSGRWFEGKRVLEPSCGCGRFLDALRKAGAGCTGIEVDRGRAMEAQAKGHSVIMANFLEVIPDPNPKYAYDAIVMNPPFYGKHYAKHVDHAMSFLKPGGLLIAILPSSARYDHGLVDGSWDDLPVGSFSESGTNINTSILTKRKPD